MNFSDSCQVASYDTVAKRGLENHAFIWVLLRTFTTIHAAVACLPSQEDPTMVINKNRGGVGDRVDHYAVRI